MQIKSIELKTLPNGKQYKLLTFTAQFQGKDRASAFQGTPHFGLNVGDTVDDSLFYINSKGYLSLSDHPNTPAAVHQQPQVTPLDVKMGFMHQEIKVMHEKVNRILAKLELRTPAEKVEDIRNQPAVMPSWDDVPPLTDDDVPF